MHAQSCLTLCNPMDYSPSASSVHEISQARILEWVEFPSPRVLPDPGTEPMFLASPALAGGFFTTAPPGKPQRGWTSCKNNSRGKSDKIIKPIEMRKCLESFLSFFSPSSDSKLSKWIRYRIKILMSLFNGGRM